MKPVKISIIKYLGMKVKLISAKIKERIKSIKGNIAMVLFRAWYCEHCDKYHSVNTVMYNMAGWNECSVGLASSIEETKNEKEPSEIITLGDYDCYLGNIKLNEDEVKELQGETKCN